MLHWKQRCVFKDRGDAVSSQTSPFRSKMRSGISKQGLALKINSNLKYKMSLLGYFSVQQIKIFQCMLDAMLKLKTRLYFFLLCILKPRFKNTCVGCFAVLILFISPFKIKRWDNLNFVNRIVIGILVRKDSNSILAFWYFSIEQSYYNMQVSLY